MYVGEALCDVGVPRQSSCLAPTQDSTGKPLVETRITFNGGGKWQRIRAPKSFAHPKCNRCGVLY